MEAFLDSPVRTEDPSAANMFYVPSFTYSYSDNGGIGNDHLAAVIHHIKHSYSWWNRTGGRDHFFVSRGGLGGATAVAACVLAAAHHLLVHTLAA